MVGGDMVTWAQNTPHRVENTKGLNISLSTEHLTSRARRQINVHIANRFLRKKLGITGSSNPDGIVAAAKVAACRASRMVSKLFPTAEEKKFKYPVKYQVDLDAEYGISSLGESNAAKELVEV